MLQYLLQILSDQERDAELRSTVALALGILGNTEAIGILSWALKDEAQPVRLAALHALMQLEEESELSKPTDAPVGQDNEQAAPTPLSIIIATLKGKVEPAKASTQALEPDKASTPSDQVKITPDDAQPVMDAESVSAEGLQSTVDSETASIEQQRPAMSTLEAIAQDNVEAALLMNRLMPQNYPKIQKRLIRKSKNTGQSLKKILSWANVYLFIKR